MNTLSRPSLANLAVSLAAGIAMATYGWARSDPPAAAETLYLAVWSTAVLIALSAIALPPALDLAAAAFLVTLVVWVVPHGPVRGAAVGLLLTAAFATVTLRYLEKTGGSLTWGWAVASAAVLQYLCRSYRFLHLELDRPTLVSLLLLPVVIGALFMMLQRREGTLPSLLAVATVALLVPGWSVTAALSLLAVLAGVLFQDRRVPRWLDLALTLVIVLAADAWQPSLGWLLLLVILAKALPENWKTGGAAIVATGLLCIFLPAAREWSEVVRWMALGPILLPALVLPSDTRRTNSIQAFVLAILALRTVGGPAAMAAPLALGALSLRSRAVAAHLQLLWTGALLTAVSVLGGYPWLRAPALEESLSLFGLRVGWPHAVTAAAVLWILTFFCAAMESSRRRIQCRPVVIGGGLLAVLAWLALPTVGERPFDDRIQILSSKRGQLEVDLGEPWKTSSLVVDSYLDNSATLPVGTPVAHLTLVGRDGKHRSWMLRVGIETGDWAARRPDVAGLGGFEAPPHWLAQVPAGGEFFAQRYRDTWVLDQQTEVQRLTIERADSLPDELTLTIFHLELRR